MRLTHMLFMSLTVLVAALLVPVQLDAWEPCDPVDFVTDNWTDFYSMNTTLDGVLVPVGACIDAVDSSGIHCGTASAFEPGSWGIMHVYGDDATTPERDGPKQGDTIYFYINGYPAEVVSGTPVYDGGIHAIDLAAVVPVLDAEFTGEPTEGCAPLEVCFTDQSEGDPTSWDWDFGDGGTSTEQNPCHTYEAGGVYTVALTVTNGTGGSDTETKIDYVTVNEAPGAEFVGDQTEGCAPLEVCFTDQSTGDVTGWEWDFGDGGTSTEQNPCHTYSTEGTYTVALTVTGPCGSDTETKVDYITIYGVLEAEFVGDQTEGCVPLEVCFTDQTMGDVTSWEWDFGDGGTSTEQNPCHTYETAGMYTVALTVTGPCGSDTETKVDYITVYGAPMADFTREPAAGCVPLEVCFTDQSTGDVTSWEWDFGDGATSTEQNPCHTYETAGIYSACLVVNGPCGDDTLCMDVTAEECVCVADFTGNPTSGCAPLEVCFTDMSAGDVTSWEWDFGDGGTSTEQNPCYTYEMAGAYTVCLTVYCTEGDATECKTNYVVVGTPPVVGFEGMPTCGSAPFEVCFTDQSTGDVASWEWDFGDGGTSTEQNPCHTYETPGTYTVCLTASDAAGCEAMGCEEDYITVFGPWEPCDPPAFLTSTWTDFFSMNTCLDGDPVPVGACIDAIDPDGVHCGTYTVQTAGSYGLMHVYGDDPTTPHCDEGAEAGDIITFYINGMEVPVTSGDPIWDEGVHEVDLGVCGVPCEADFAGEPTAGCAPLEVCFTDLSTGDVSSWEWDFGDGGMSDDQHPCHTYEAPGTYTVCLTAYCVGGSMDTECKEEYITVGAGPTAEFVGEPTEGCAPLEVCFTDQSMGDVTDWEWDFGDGMTSAEQNPCHTYEADGMYTVALTVTGPCGSDTETKVDYVLVHEGVLDADFMGEPTEGCVPLEVCFTDQSLGDVTAWEWDFGDGMTSTEQNPCHTYEAEGMYTVALTVTGPCGSDTETKVDYVAVVGAPEAEFFGEPTEGIAPLEVCFTDQSTGDVTSWEWDFGDGMTSAEQNPCHTYEAEGMYTVALTVTGPCGSDTERKVEYIHVYAEGELNAEFVGEPTQGCVPLYVCFTDQSTGEITGWSWDFGDEGTSAEQNPCHKFRQPGKYTVSLTVTGPSGADIETKVDYIEVRGGPYAQFTGEPTEGAAPLEVCFTDESEGKITSWQWDFGDGGTSTERNPCHTYAAPDTYTVVLTVTGPCGSDSEWKKKYIAVTGDGVLDAEFVGEPTEGCAYLDVCFTDQSVGEVTSWEWDFGDGGTSAEQNPCHKYMDPGMYTVSLTVTGPAGTDTETKADYIAVYDTVVAEFAGEPTEGLVPLEVCFTDQSTGDITSWEWDFGDGMTSAEQNPCHTYEAADTYTVVLTATGPCGSDSEIKKGYIVVCEDEIVDAEFMGEPTQGCAPLRVCFTDQSVGEITSWEWEFGDGGTSTEQNLCHTYEAEGMYTVSLTVTGPSGTDTETKTDYITVGGELAAEFVGEPTEGLAPLEVCFTDQSAGEITTWEWGFGDGGTSTEQNPCHTYEAEGVYTVTLTVTGPCGCDSETKESYITVSEEEVCDAEFVGEPTEGAAPLYVCFTDHSIGEITGWEWDFGDGGTSTEQNPCHKFREPGNYTVSLTVTGPCGTDTETKVDYITVHLTIDVWLVGDSLASSSIFTLAQNWPNPFTGSTKITYTLRADTYVVIEIYETSGTLVKTIVDELGTRGTHYAEWDGTDASGVQVPSGAYFYRIMAGEFSHVKKMILLR